MALKRWLASGKFTDDSAKRQKLDDSGLGGPDPQIIVTWNCNSLVKRAENNAGAIAQFVKGHSPHVVCLQEVYDSTMPTGE
jgi:hypothetical protein